jgi:mRNA interferase MazF
MKRGEIWLVQLDPTVDREIGKTRPAVIVNDNDIGILPLKVIVPITDWKAQFAGRPWMVLVEPSAGNGLMKVSGVDTFQIRSLSEGRLVRRLGVVEAAVMAEIGQALTTVLALTK